ncbi:hypothetical protein PAMA_008945 [Pampus argenteus]
MKLSIFQREKQQGFCHSPRPVFHSLTVIDANSSITPPTVKVLEPSDDECQSSKDKIKKKTLVCVATGFYPDHVSVYWQVNGENVTTGVATDNTAVKDGKYYNMSSRLTVLRRHWFTHGVLFNCTVTFFNGTDTVQRSNWVYGVKGPGATTIREKYLKVTQTAKLSYAVLIVKSSIYGVFVVILVLWLQGSSGKQKTESEREADSS